MVNIKEVESSLFKMKAAYSEEDKAIYFHVEGRANVDLAIEVEQAAVDYIKANDLNLYMVCFDLSDMSGTFTQGKFRDFTLKEFYPTLKKHGVQHVVSLMGGDPFTIFASKAFSKLVSGMKIHIFKDATEYENRRKEVLSQMNVS